MALFGKTAKQWRDENPKADGNMRDHATIEQLVILSNLESINAILIQQDLPQSTRLEQLNAIAITQMTSLMKNSTHQKFEMKIETGTIINQYKILSSIGKGGMGEVYLAEDTKLDRQIALKILPTEFAEDAERMSRFVREAKSASALNHPNIITIYEINEFENTHYIATEFIDGKTLDDYAKDNPLSYKSALDIAIQVASGLDEAHEAGIVHRDIKPDNVMIRENGLAKILDFGIAKLTEKQDVEIDSEDATAIQQPSTSPGMIIGTANYMSPEQAKGEVG